VADNIAEINEPEERHPVFCYILECSDGTFYTGWTVNVQRRLKKHQSGAGAKYTRQRRPVKLVYAEELSSRSEALKRERQLKRLKRERKLALINNFVNTDILENNPMNSEKQ